MSDMHTVLLDILASDGSIHDTRVLTPTIGDSIRIGRISSDKSKGFNANADNALFDSRVMSRQHAEIEVTTGLPGPLFIKDTSKYGTFVNDKRMAKGQPTMISDGDQLTFGNTVTDTNTGISHHPIKAQIHFNQRDPSPMLIDTQPHRSFKCPSESELDEDDDDDDFDDFESHVEADDLPQDYPLSDSESPTPSDVWADDDSAWEAEHADDDDDDYYPVFYQSDCALPFNSRDVSPSYSTESSSDSICEPVGPPPHPQLAAQHASEPPTITVLDASNPVVTVGDLAPVEPDTFSSNGRHADSQLPEPAVRTRVSRFDKEAPPQPHPHPETTNAITSQNVADPHRKSRFDRPAYRPAEMRPASAYVGLSSQAGPRPCPSTFSSDLARGPGTSLPPWRKMMGVPMHDARSYRYGPDHVAEYTPMDWYEPSYSHHPVDLVPNYGVATPSTAPPFPGVRFRNWDFGHEAPRNSHPKVPMDFLLNTDATPAASQPAAATAPDAETSSRHRSPPKPRADSRLAIDHLLEPKGTPTAPVATNIAAGKKRKADELATPELLEAKPILSTPVAQTSDPDQVIGLATPPSSEPSLSPPAKRLKHAVSSALTAGAYAALGSIATIGFLASPLAERLAGF